MAAYAESATVLIGQLIGQKYQLRRILGEGGMGAVFEALNTWTSKRVALKLMLGTDAKHQDFVMRFQREAKAIGRIEHENIVQVIDLGVHEGNFFLVQEFLEGHDLRAELDERGVLPPRETRDILVPIMSGIAAAHAQGVVHRDVKPQNLFLHKNSSGKMVPKVIDFGIAKLVDQDDGNVSLTRTGAAIGTPLYMSPEQARGDRSLDAQTDIWSIGIVMFECLTGECPFDGNNHNEVIAKILTMNAPPLHSLGDFSQSLSGVVAKALERTRDKRYRTMDEFREAVASCPEFARDSAVEINHSAQQMSILPGLVDATTMGANSIPGQPNTQIAGSVANGLAANAPDPLRDKQTKVLGPSKAAAEPAFSTIGDVAVTKVDGSSTAVAMIAKDSTHSEVRAMTLSSSSAEKAKAPTKLPIAALVGAGALVVVVIAAAKLSNSSGNSTTQQPVVNAVVDAGTGAAQTVQQPPPLMGEFGMAVSVDPPHATIEIDGRSVGIGAYAARFIRNGEAHHIRVSCTGYTTQDISFTDAPPPGRISLVRVPGSANARTLPRADAGARPVQQRTNGSGTNNGGLIRGYE